MLVVPVRVLIYDITSTTRTPGTVQRSSHCTIMTKMAVCCPPPETAITTPNSYNISYNSAFNLSSTKSVKQVLFYMQFQDNVLNTKMLLGNWGAHLCPQCYSLTYPFTLNKGRKGSGDISINDLCFTLRSGCDQLDS